MPPHKAVIFDMDGTLLNTLEDLADCANTLLMEQGLAPRPVDAYRHFAGKGAENLMRRAAPQGTDEATLKRLTAGMRSLYAREGSRKTRPYKGIESMLHGLTAASIALAVLSNKPHELTRATVRRFFPDIAFAAVHGSPQGGLAKPDPALALDIAKNLGLRPEDVLFTGDTPTDMKTAAAAGMLPVGVLWGFRGQEELLAHGAAVLLSKPEDIFTYI